MSLMVVISFPDQLNSICPFFNKCEVVWGSQAAVQLLSISQSGTSNSTPLLETEASDALSLFSDKDDDYDDVDEEGESKAEDKDTDTIIVKTSVRDAMSGTKRSRAKGKEKEETFDGEAFVPSEHKRSCGNKSLGISDILLQNNIAKMEMNAEKQKILECQRQAERDEDTRRFQLNFEFQQEQAKMQHEECRQQFEFQ